MRGREMGRPSSRPKKRDQRVGGVGRGADTTGGTVRRPQKSAGQAKTASPAGAFGPLAKTSPVGQIQRRQQAKTVRAQKRAPARPTPAVPIIRNPTRAQTEAAKQLVRRSVQGQSGGDPAQTRRVLRELETDPRTRRAVTVSRYYDNATNEQLALSYLRKLGVKGGTRAQRVGAGRAAIAAVSSPVKAKAGRGPTTLSAGIGPSVNLTALGRTLSNATSLGASSAENQFFKNALGDVKGLATSPFVGGYEVGASLLEAAQGDTGRAQRLAKGVGEGIVQSVPGRLVRGDLKGAGEEFVRHPVFGVLDLSAAGAVAGRTAGGLARAVGSTPEAAGFRGAAARAGSTVRPPIALVDDAGTQSLVHRTYSKSSDRKAAQVLADRELEPLKREDGSPVTVKDRGREVPVLKAPAVAREHLQRREADFGAARANSVERLVRDEAGREMRVRGIRGRSSRDLVSMVVEGTITSAKHFDEDLRAHATRLRTEIERHEAGDKVYRHTDELAAAKGRLELVEKVLSSPRALRQKEKIVEVGIELGRKLNVAEREAIGVGLLDPVRAGRSRRVPVAVEHLGARWSSKDELLAPRAAEERAASAALRSRRTEAQQARVAFARKVTNAQRGVRQARVSYLRSDKSYREAESAFRVLRSRKEKLRAAVREAERNGGKVTVKLGGDELSLTAATARSMLVATSKAQRTSAQKLAGIARELNDKPVIAQNRQGVRQPTAKASVKRAERRVLAARAGRDKATQARLARAVADHDEAVRMRAAVKGGAVRRENGQFLSNDEIDDFLRARGRDPETVAYLPHRLDIRGRRAFHTQLRPGSRSSMDKAESRTGEAYRKGATEASAKLIQEQGVRQATQISKARQLDRMVTDQGLKRPNGAYFTGKEAAELADRIEADTGQRLVPMRAFAAKLSPETRRMIRDDLQGPGGMESLGQRLLNDRVVTDSNDNARNVVLVPTAYVEQLNRHLRPAGSIQKFFQTLNRPFRFAVLAQPRWLTGNFVEPFIVRLTTVGSGINVFGLGVDITAANKLLKQMERSGDPKMRAAAQELRAQHLGGLFIGGRGASVKRSVDELPVYGEFVSRLPVVRQGAEAIRLAGRALMAPGNAYFRINRAIEAVAQRAALGHDVRKDLREFRGSWLATLRLHHDALEEVGRGLVNTPTQRRFMRSQHELLGKYEGYPPWLREVIQGPMPFLPWALNAARFVFWTMPAHRTVQTALLTKVNDVVAKDWEEIHKDVPPGSLKLAIPTKKGGWVDLARYTPYGLTGPASEGELQGVTDQFVPQLSGAIAAAQGQDPFGRPLRLEPTKDNPDGAPSGLQKAGIAAYGLAEALTPYVSQVRRLREKGGTAYAGSTVWDPDVKPETVGQMSAARRTFDPFRPVYLRAPAGGAAVSGGGGGGLLERAAEREAQGGLSSVQMELLERAAR